MHNTVLTETAEGTHIALFSLRRRSNPTEVRRTVHLNSETRAAFHNSFSASIYETHHLP